MSLPTDILERLDVKINEFVHECKAEGQSFDVYMMWQTEQDCWEIPISRLPKFDQMVIAVEFDIVGDAPTKEIIDLFNKHEMEVYGDTVEAHM